LLSIRSGLRNSAASWVCTLPLSDSGPNSAPWLPPQASAVLEAKWLLLFVTAGQVFWESFRSPLRPVAFTSRSATILQTFDTTFFSLWPMSSDRVLGVHASLSLAVRQNPLALFFRARLPSSRSLASLSPECCRLSSSFVSRFPSPGFHLAVLRATRAT